MNVESELEDPTSMLNLYRALISLRKSMPALQHGSYRSLDGVPPVVYAFLRQSGDVRIVVVLNFSKEPQQVHLPDLVDGEAALSTFLDRQGPVNLQNLELRGDEGLIVLLKTL